MNPKETSNQQPAQTPIPVQPIYVQPKDKSDLDDYPYPVVPTPQAQVVDPTKPIYNGSCWKRSYNRGAGKAPTFCPHGYEKQGLACWPECNKGYQGYGADCRSECPDDFHDGLLYCGKPPALPRKGGDTTKQHCEKINKTECEKEAVLWYEKCPKHYHKVGCCTCSPDCPKHMDDIGISCHKDIRIRQAEPLECDPGFMLEVGLCY